MRQRKYPFMIVGGPSGLSLGMEAPNGYKVSASVIWDIVNEAFVEATLDRLEVLIDRQKPGSHVDVKA